jgi:hypothetical protein
MSKNFNINRKNLNAYNKNMLQNKVGIQMINKKLYPILIIFSILYLVSCGSNNSMQNNSLEQIPKEASNESNDNLNKKYDNFNGFDITKDNLEFIIDGKHLNLKLPIYLDKNRYYISLNEFIEKLNGKITKDDNSLIINLKDKLYLIDLSNNLVKCPNTEFTLKKNLLDDNDMYYIGFSDFSNMLNLYTRWDKDNKIINCKIDGFNNTNITPYKAKINQIGLIRFEDIGLNSEYYSNEYFERLRIIASYVNQRKIPYHIAWIPRNVIPSNKVDDDPFSKNNFNIAEMVYTLDYFSTHNGIIGLHGYTHQLGNSESGAGFEFGRFQPSTSEFKKKIEKAIETAKYLDVPIDFFEVPHYEITSEQNKIAEKYFKILYYPFNDYGKNKTDLTKPQLSPYNRYSYYISTPLGYIPDGEEDAALAKLKNININNMGSIFFHPNLEKKYISLIENSNREPTFNYADNSTLKKLISSLEAKGFTMIKVTDI